MLAIIPEFLHLVLDLVLAYVLITVLFIYSYCDAAMGAHFTLYVPTS